MGSLDGKLLRENIRVKGDSGHINLTGLMMKAGQGDHIEGWGIRSLIRMRVIRFQGWGILSELT